MNVLFVQQVPQLTTEVAGPRKMTVGQQAKFRITLVNNGQVKADDVVVKVGIPRWAKLDGSTPSEGVTQMSTDGQESGTLLWSIRELDISRTEYVDLTIVPGKGQPLELTVRSTSAPPSARALVEVQEPKLNVIISGPSDILFGETKRFELMLSNPGTGPAENVVIHLYRVGGRDRVADVHKLGTLQPGMSKKIEVELVARQAGTLLVKAHATADGGLDSEVTKEVMVRRPALRVELNGPESQYAGTLATYSIKVSNPGTAAAESVSVSATIPQGAKFVDASDGGRLGSGESKVSWQIGTLQVETESVFELQCLLKEPGKNRLEVFCEAAADLTDATVMATDVIALADLTLDVSDPTGPVAVGGEAKYEIQIRNRGTKRAERIEVVTFFSDGVEPMTAEGAEHEVGPGQVVFKPIKSLDAGRKIVLTIKVKANRPGNHICRTEVLCREVDTKLAAEETTKFYGANISQSRSSSRSGRPARLTVKPTRKAVVQKPTGKAVIRAEQ